MGYDFEGKVALVTGAGGRRGIGRATALRLARDGADVAVMDISWPADLRPADERGDQWDGVRSVAAEIEALGRRGLALEGDISLEREVEDAVRQTVARLGRIDLFVANATARPGGDRVPIIELPQEELRRVITVNLIGTFLCCKAVGRHMVDRGGGGAVVIVSSQSARIAKPRIAAYGASKFGQIGLTQAFAQEMAPYGVRVNAVCPGLVDTARLDWSAQGFAGAGNAEETRARIVAEQGRSIPLGRIGTADEVASVIGFLCSSDASHVTGQLLGVDGGSRM
jgi:NAD(P)-dependent dehydrogenase (short-subunit alcohol dehydrogenase family)